MTNDKEDAYLTIASAIKDKVLCIMQDAKVEVVNESDSHAGHIGRSGYAVSHLRVTVISDYFSDMQKLSRQRLMHKILETEIKMVHSMTFLLLTNTEASL